MKPVVKPVAKPVLSPVKPGVAPIKRVLAPVKPVVAPVSPESIVVRRDVMPAKTSRPTAEPIATLEDVMARSGARDRANIEKHIAASEAEATPDHAKLWKRLASKIASLAHMPVQTVGLQAVLFFIPDGKYRMQVFALEDKNEGQILLYLPDVLAAAIKNKIITKIAGDEYSVVGSKDQTFTIQALDASNTSDPPPHIKNMIGWNRKAVRVTLKTTSSDSPQVVATEAMMELAATKWMAK